MKYLIIILTLFIISCGGEEFDINDYCWDKSGEVTKETDPASKVIRRNVYNLCLEIYGD